jgi:hypothetical protein
MPALPMLQARPVVPASLPVATAAAAAGVMESAPPLLRRSISASNQAVQPVVSAQNGVDDGATAASSESLKAHATALKVCAVVAYVAGILNPNEVCAINFTGRVVQLH